MKPDQIVAFLTALGVTNAKKTKRTGWVISRCPLGPWQHDNGVSLPEAFGIRIEPGDPFAHCWSCQFHGTTGELYQRMVGLNKVRPRLEANWAVAREITDNASSDFELDMEGDFESTLTTKKGLHEFPEWWLETFPYAIGVQAASNYLFKRDVPGLVAKGLDLRWDPTQRRVCFPVRDFNGKLVGLHGRAIDDDVKPKYRMYTQAGQNNPIVWLGESWVDLTKPIVVVEGPFDLASVRRVYPNVVSPLFATPSVEKIKRMADALDWVTFFDHGTAGDQGRFRISQALGKAQVVRHCTPPAGVKDPGACTLQQLVATLGDVVPLTSI